jgi:hypothetical protein
LSTKTTPLGVLWSIIIGGNIDFNVNLNNYGNQYFSENEKKDMQKKAMEETKYYRNKAGGLDE